MKFSGVNSDVNFMSYPNNIQPMTDSSFLLENRDLLRQRMKEEGYLFFKSIIPTKDLINLRSRIVQILESKGWIQGGVDLMDANAVGIPYREGEENFFEVMDEIVKLEALHSLAHNPSLISLMRLVLGESVFPHPLSITRLVFPKNPEITTPPHQDYRNNQGTENLTAAWVPLSDCPMSMGPIAILKGSHKFGLQPLEFHLGAGNRRATLTSEVASLPWVSADFKLGDVLLFPALTIHSAIENKHDSRMRLSVDFRYQLEGEALTPQSLSPHFGRIEWSDIYSGWLRDDFKYFWHSRNYQIVSWNDDLQALPDEHMKEAVRQTQAYNKRRIERHNTKINKS